MEGFDKIFKEKEFKQLLGEKNKDLRILILIIFVTFFALAHILGGQQELEERMSNPFTNWVNLPNSRITGGNMSELVTEMKKQDVLDSFKVINANYYQINWLQGLSKSFEYTKKIRLRSLDFEDPIMKSVLDPQNVEHKTKDAISDCHILITKEALENLDYYKYHDTMYLPVYDNEYDQYKLILFLPISHVVRELPNNVDVVVSNTFMSLLNGKIKESKFYDQSKTRSLTLLSKEEIEQKKIEEFLEDSVEISKIESEKFHLNGEYYFKNVIQLYSKISFVEALKLKKEMTSSGVFSYIEFNCNSDVKEEIHQHYYALNFDKLKKIREFRDFAKNEFDVNISLAQVESKDNFYLISLLAQMFIYLLIGFSMFSIIVFIQNVIRNHLEKVKPILGTLKAFGLKDEKIRKLYMFVVHKFFGLASVIAFAFLGLYYLVLKVFEVELFFDLINLKLVFIWLALVSILTLFFYRFIAKILFKSPGDLIYNR